MKLRTNRARLLSGVSVIGAVLALSACTPVVTTAYIAQNAPPPAWANIAGFEEYEWIDRADALSQAVGEAPPDYSFVSGSSEPWVWNFEDGSLLMVENRADGLHSYYFEAGSDTPFLVRDPEMSFGFLDGGVAVVYGPDGGALSRDEAEGWLYAALSGYQRGRTLRRALAATQERRAVQALAWLDTSYLFFDWRRDWDDGIRRHPNWQRVRDGVRGRERRGHWDGERRRRHDAEQGFRRWGENGWRGRAPGNWMPPPTGTVMPPVGQHAGGPRGPGPRGPGGPGAGNGPRGPGGPGAGNGPRPGQQAGAPPGRPPRTDGPGDSARRDREMESPLEGGLQPDLGMRPPAPGRSVQRPGAGAPVRQQALPPVPATDTAPPPPPPAAVRERGDRPDRGMMRPGSGEGRSRNDAQGVDTVTPRVQVQAPSVPDQPARVVPQRGDDGQRSRPSFRQPDSQPARVRPEGFQTPAPSYTAPPAPSYSPPPAPSYSAPPPPPPSYSAPAPSYSAPAPSPPPPSPAPSYSAPSPSPPPPPSPSISVSDPI